MNDKRVLPLLMEVNDNKLDSPDVVMIILVHLLEMRMKDSTWFLVKEVDRIPQMTSLLCSKKLFFWDAQRQLLLISVTVPLDRSN